MAFRIQYNSPVILSFTLLTIVVFTLNNVFGGQIMPYFTLSPSFESNQILSYFQLVSHVLGHSSMEHLTGNLTFILLLGPIIEEKYGSISSFMMILLTAFITGILHSLLFPFGLLGASGIVFMFIVLVSFTNVENNKIPLTFVIIAILFIGKEVVNSFQNDNVSQFAHIIGGVFGALFGMMLNRRKIQIVSNDF